MTTENIARFVVGSYKATTDPQCPPKSTKIAFFFWELFHVALVIRGAVLTLSKVGQVTQQDTFACTPVLFWVGFLACMAPLSLISLLLICAVPAALFFVVIKKRAKERAKASAMAQLRAKRDGMPSGDERM